MKENIAIKILEKALAEISAGYYNHLNWTTAQIQSAGLVWWEEAKVDYTKEINELYGALALLRTVTNE